MAALPYFDEIDPQEIDILLVSHFHLDHCGALPFFTEKTNFQGRVFMTHPTKAIYKLLLQDYVKVSNISVEDMLYDQNDLNNSMVKIEVMDYHQVLEHNGIKFWCYNAGHVLGAAMFMIEIAGIRVLYTGDFSREEDRHLKPAEVPEVAVDVLIVESTYGVQIHEPRKEREARFTGSVYEVVRRGGKCLMPVFALGRAQELLLILDEFWQSHSELRQVPIFYASSLARKCLSVFQTYVNMMGDNVKKRWSQGDNPFEFKHIYNLKSVENLHDVGPCVVMASPGMLQSGLSRELFELWCTDKKNGLVVTGYCVEGTLAKQVLNEPSEVQLMSGEKVPLRMSVKYISFSAHSDFIQTSEFIDQMRPPNVVLVHGEQNEMGRLKSALVDKYQNKIQVLAPKNCQSIQFKFRGEKFAKTIGSLAKVPPAEQPVMAGVIVKQDFNHHIMAAKDLPNYTTLSASTVTQRQKVPFQLTAPILVHSLRQIYDNITADPENKHVIKVADIITLTVSTAEKTVTLEWVSSPTNDMIADSVVLMLLQMDANPSPGLLRALETVHTEQQLQREKQIIASSILKQIFGNAKLDVESGLVSITAAEASATVDVKSRLVSCEDDGFRSALEDAVSKIFSALDPLCV
eukprot:GILI01018269.1.p1 GENE.GILI01018269.1~~GILI01018269.1.p1  ORF type:complete len:702 (-),score=178.30 GILI01018269.1:143-2035(-)